MWLIATRAGATALRHQLAPPGCSNRSRGLYRHAGPGDPRPYFVNQRGGAMAAPLVRRPAGAWRRKQRAEGLRRSSMRTGRADRPGDGRPKATDRPRHTAGSRSIWASGYNPAADGKPPNAAPTSRVHSREHDIVRLPAATPRTAMVATGANRQREPGAERELAENSRMERPGKNSNSFVRDTDHDSADAGARTLRPR